jgi:hypothetical protein
MLIGNIYLHSNNKIYDNLIMNNILYNISLIILSLGIILITVYVTKATSTNYLTYYNQLLANQENKSYKPYNPYLNVYNDRPTQTYKNMFLQSEPWLGYETYDPNQSSTKLFIY